MAITRESKKVVAEFLNRVAQILFAAVIVGPFVTGNLKIETSIVGIAGTLVALLFAILVAQTVKEGA